MFPILPAIQAGAAIAGAFRKRAKGPSIYAINQKYLGFRPEGYLTDADRAQVERTQLRGTQAAARSGVLARGSAYRQATARGLSGASAAALGESAGEQEARDRESAAQNAAGQEYDIYGNNRDYERQKFATAWGNEVSEAQRREGQNAQQQAGFWNSVLEAAPSVANMFSPNKPLATSLNPNDYGGTAGPDLQPRGPYTRSSYNPRVTGREDL